MQNERTIRIVQRQGWGLEKNGKGLSCTIGELAHIPLMAGDRIVFEGGVVYEGGLRLSGVEGPIQLISEGPFPAVIFSGTDNGLVMENCTDVTVAGLCFCGSGWKKEYHTSGIMAAFSRRIRLLNCEVSDYPYSGIEIWGSEQVQISGCFSHDNGAVGIVSEGPKNKAVYIGYSKTYDNAGYTEITDNHSGSGIILANTDDAVVEYCESAGNGWAQRQCNTNGPVGIWCACGCENILFRKCIARDNRTQPGAGDGGGFDFDGAVVESRMERCYSYHNEGAGYLLCEYGSGMPWKNNTVDVCVSFEDGARVPDYGPVVYYGPETSPIYGGAIRRSLLVPAPGHPCVEDARVGGDSSGNEIADCVMVADGTAPVSTGGKMSFVRKTRNLVDVNAGLHSRIMQEYPRLTEPRDLDRLPVFDWLEKPENTEARQPLTEENFLTLLRCKEREEAAGKPEFSMELGGMDLEGCEYDGDVRLWYDSIQASCATRMVGPSRIVFPLPGLQDGKTYHVRVCSRPTSPHTKAALFIEEKGVCRRIPLNGSVTGPFWTIASFTVQDAAGLRAGIYTEEGVLFVGRWELWQGEYPTDTLGIRTFGDATREEETDGGRICLYGVRSAAVLETAGPALLHYESNVKASLYCRSAEGWTELPLDSGHGERLISSAGEERQTIAIVVTEDREGGKNGTFSFRLAGVTQ